MENDMLMTRKVKVGSIAIGGEGRIVVQTMCNTHTSDIESSVNDRTFFAASIIVYLFFI